MEAHYNIGIIQRDKGQLVAAIKSFQSALKIDSEHSESMGSLGKALLKYGRPDQGRKWLAKSEGVILFDVIHGIEFKGGTGHQKN